MNNLMMLLEKTDMTPTQQSAVEAHKRLIYDKQMVDISFEAMCRDLKEIRDCKYFITLGFEQFGEYTEKVHGIGARMAYKYIRAYEQFGGEFLNSSSKMGITKLLTIATLDKDEREEFLAEHTTDELAAMSTDEVRKLTEQIKKLEEQISFLESAPKEETVEQKPFDEIEAEIRAEVEGEYEQKIAELEQKIEETSDKVISDDEFDKFKANAEKEAKAAAVAEVKKAKEESAEELKKLKADLKAALDASDKKDTIAKNGAKAIADAEQRAKQAEEKAKQAAEDLKRVAELEAKIAAAEAEKLAVEKQIKLSNDPELTRFKFIFESWQNMTAELAEQLLKLDADKQGKMKAAIKAVVDGVAL